MNNAVQLTLTFRSAETDHLETSVVYFSTWESFFLALADSGILWVNITGGALVLDKIKAAQPVPETSLLLAYFDPMPVETKEDVLAALSALSVNLRTLQSYQADLAKANLCRALRIALHPKYSEPLMDAMLAADNLADVFLQAYRRLKRIDPNTGKPRWFIQLTVASTPF